MKKQEGKMGSAVENRRWWIHAEEEWDRRSKALLLHLSVADDPLVSPLLVLAAIVQDAILQEREE